MVPSKLNVSPEIESFLEGHRRALAQGRIDVVRMLPLLMEGSLTDLLRRRATLFIRCDVRQTRLGHTVSFLRHLKPRQKDSQAREVAGVFDALPIPGSPCSVLVSTLAREPYLHGPRLIADYAYPLARRPLVASTALCRLVNEFATLNAWTATSVDAIGYDRELGSFRRDTKPQPVEDVLAEMREQGRLLHQAKVVFRDTDRRRMLTASFNRNAEVAVYRGAVIGAFKDFVLPAVDGVLGQQGSYDIAPAEEVASQEILHLVFDEPVFLAREDMEEFCRLVRQVDGLSVTPVHLNPYLQAQVLDFFTGVTVDLLVMNERTVTLVPRSDNCRAALERITDTVFRYYGEPEIKKEAIGVA